MAELFQLDLPNRDHAVAVAQAACLAAADRLGLAPEKRTRLELVVEEVVVNSVHHAYPADETGVIRVSARVDGAVFSVQVQDWGLPFDPTEAVPYSVEDPDLRGLGLHLAWKSCDEAEFRNLGRQGKRFDLRFRLPGQPLTVLNAPEAAAPAPVDGKAARRPQIDLRPFRPADAPGVARCAWLAYGYTKPDDHLYDPPELVRRNADGVMASVVALDESGTVVGHSCLDFSGLAHAPEATDLVVAPVARSNPILVQRLLQALNDIARERGCLGALANAVTAHTVSQRGALRFGGVPIHVHLASVSTEWELTPGSSGGGAVRQSEVAFYIPLHTGPQRTIHAPARHRGVIADILTATGEPVTFAEPGAVEIPDQPTELTVESGLLAWGHVLMSVKVYGRDAVAVIAGFLRRFCADGVATVLLELPLGDPATAVMADSVERLGFSIAGVFPNAPEPGGDTLIYQYLNNVIPDLAGERVATACRPLYDHVVAERRRIDREVFGASFPDAAPQEPTP